MKHHFITKLISIQVLRFNYFKIISRIGLILVFFCCMIVSLNGQNENNPLEMYIDSSNLLSDNFGETKYALCLKNTSDVIITILEAKFILNFNSSDEVTIELSKLNPNFRVQSIEKNSFQIDFKKNILIQQNTSLLIGTIQIKAKNINNKSEINIPCNISWGYMKYNNNLTTQQSIYKANLGQLKFHANIQSNDSKSSTLIFQDTLIREMKMYNENRKEVEEVNHGKFKQAAFGLELMESELVSHENNIVLKIYTPESGIYEISIVDEKANILIEYKRILQKGVNKGLLEGAENLPSGMFYYRVVAPSGSSINGKLLRQ